VHAKVPGRGTYKCRFHASQNHKDPGRGKTTREADSPSNNLNCPFKKRLFLGDLTPSTQSNLFPNLTLSTALNLVHRNSFPKLANSPSYFTQLLQGGGLFRKACRSRKKESKQSEITCKPSDPARTISQIQKRREFVRALSCEQCPKNSFKRLYIVKVGLGISRTNADSQWNPVYNVFHRNFCCGNETIRR